MKIGLFSLFFCRFLHWNKSDDSMVLLVLRDLDPLLFPDFLMVFFLVAECWQLFANFLVLLKHIVTQISLRSTARKSVFKKSEKSLYLSLIIWICAFEMQMSCSSFQRHLLLQEFFKKIGLYSAYLIELPALVPWESVKSLELFVIVVVDILKESVFRDVCCLIFEGLLQELFDEACLAKHEHGR